MPPSALPAHPTAPHPIAYVAPPAGHLMAPEATHIYHVPTTRYGYQAGSAACGPSAYHYVQAPYDQNSMSRYVSAPAYSTAPYYQNDPYYQQSTYERYTFDILMDLSLSAW